MMFTLYETSAATTEPWREDEIDKRVVAIFTSPSDFVKEKIRNKDGARKKMTDEYNNQWRTMIYSWRL